MQRNVKVLFAATILLLIWNAQAAAGIWRDVSPAQPGARAAAKVSLFQADDQALRAALSDAPHETSGRRDHLLPIPMPDGNLVQFSVQESPIMAPGLANKFPGIKTFKVFAVDDDHASGRIDVTPRGFHGMIQTSAGRIFIDPDDPDLQDHIYRSRFDSSEPRRTFNCGVEGHSVSTTPLPRTGYRTAARVPGSLLQYDLAVAVTNEYYVAAGNTDNLATAAITTTINRVTFIYERDHGITFNLVADNDQLYESVDNGLLNNEDEFDLIAVVDDWIDTRLPGGDAAYDIGHMFSKPAFVGGGVAFIGAVCNDSIKASGVSGSPSPSGDAFDIDLVAHEIGHQFNAEHSFNGTTSSCVNRNASTAYEPGSGSSIMAYAGICAGENLQSNSDASFHSGSIAQVNAFVSGNACHTTVDTTPAGNNDPVLTAIANTTIPANTPFLLDGSATDVDLDMLEYRWDQRDAGCPTDNVSFGTDNGSNALFRSYTPRADSWRNFPALGTQIQGRYDKAEVLPCQNRALDFRLTVTDGRSGQDFEDVRVNVTNAAGPFEITNLDPAPPIVAGTPFAVTWDVAGTDVAPISCANVDIDLLTFSVTYSSYSIHSLDTVANTGSAMVTINPPESAHPRARVRVKCSNNIFYDISDVDLTVTEGAAPAVTMDEDDLTARIFANAAITSVTAPACGPVVDCSPTIPVDGGSRNGDASAIGYLWLLLMGSLAALRGLRRRQG